MSYYLIFSVLQSEDICETCGVVDVRSAGTGDEALE